MDEVLEIAKATSGIAQTKPIIRQLLQIQRETAAQNRKLKKHKVDQSKG